MPNSSATVKNGTPVKVTKVVKVKRKRSLTEFLITTIVILAIFLVLGAFFSVAVWMHTYKALTRETVVADVYVSKKVIKDGKPTFTVRYVPREDVSGWWGIFGSDARSTDAIVSSELVGDQVFFTADYIRWNNWVTLLNVKPMYKTNRVSSGFRNAEDYQRFNVSAVDINGGPDWIAAKMQENPKRYNWLAQSIYLSSAGVNVQNEDAAYKLISTKDALVLERQ
jgi:hypothetical protein